MSTKTLEDQNQTSILAGGWSTFTCDISKEAFDAFDEAMEGLLGVDYTPVAVAQQVVAGMNYSFFCNAKVVYPEAPNQAAIINIFKPLGGKKAVRIGIESIKH